MSIGLQIIGKHFKEQEMLNFANFIEQKQ
jgi:Asp-tRNA(Asn)/Glu-tRNA(Gln) amidotransferase A subunit family amidase